jgi:hypothetical protein
MPMAWTFQRPCLVRAREGAAIFRAECPDNVLMSRVVSALSG